MREILMIQLGSIQPNRYNIHNEDNEEQIQILADSISLIGLQEPLVVYKDDIITGKQMYTLLSGHKRYRAMKLLNMPAIKQVPCLVYDEKPKNEIEERQILLQNNISRKDPEEIRKQVLEASKIWNILPADMIKKYTNNFKNQFIIDTQKRKGDVTDKYVKENFRPRIEYIKRMTGLTISNKTVTNIIKKEVDKYEPTQAFPTQPDKIKVLSISEIIKKVGSLAGLIDVYNSQPDSNSNDCEVLIALKRSLDDALIQLDA